MSAPRFVEVVDLDDQKFLINPAMVISMMAGGPRSDHDESWTLVVAGNGMSWIHSNIYELKAKFEHPLSGPVDV